MPPGSRKGRAEQRERFQGPWLPTFPPLRPAGSPGTWLPSTSPVPTQSSACTLTSVISGKFNRLLQALEMQRDLALRNIEVAKTQALEQARDEKQRLQGHLEALSCCDHRIRNLLEQLDDRTFLQVPGLGAAGWGPGCLPLVLWLIAAVPGAQESQLLAPPGPLGPLTLPHWDEDQQLGGLKESLSQLCALLLEEGGHPGAPAEAADFGSMGKADPRSLSTPLGPAVLPTGVVMESGPSPHELPSRSLP